MSDLQAIKDELVNNPASMPYLALTEENDAANANVINNSDGNNPRTINRDQINAADFVAQTTYAAYDGLTAAETAYYDMVVNREQIAVTDDTLANWAAVGGSSLWATADKATMEPRIQSLMQFTGSRGVEIGLGKVLPGQIAEARQLP